MPGALADAPEGVRLVASGPSLVHFSVEIPAPALRPLVNEASADSPAEGPVGLSLEGYDEQFVPGGFALPVRVVTVAVPPAGAVRLLADPIEARVLDGVQLAPVSRKIAGPTGPGLDAERRAREGTGTAGVARLLGVSWMRNQRVARIAITPADYDGLSRRLRVYGRIDVRVEVSPGPPAGRAAEDPDPFEGVYRDVLVNYEQGKSWRRTAAAPESRVGDIEGSKGQSGSSGVFAGRSWIKIAITTTGFYKVDFGQLRSFQPFASDTTIVLDSLRLFTWPGNPVLPEENYCDTCDYREVALGIVDNGDGRFNRNSDAFYFFALGASDWADLYDPSQPDTVFVNNPYETRSYIYLTVSTAQNPVPGPFRRIANASGMPAPSGDEITPDRFQARVHRELDLDFRPHVPAFGSTMAWEKWFWQTLDLNGTFSASVDAPGADLTRPARLRTRLWGMVQTGVCHTANVQLNESIQSFSWRDRVYFRPGSSNPISLSGFTADGSFTGLRRAGNLVRVSVPSGQACNPEGERIGVAWFDLFYPHLFEPFNDELQFDTPADPGDYLFRIAPFTRTDPPRVFDVTDAYAPIEVLGAAYEVVEGGFQLSLQAAQTGLRRYRVIQETSIVKVATANISEAPVTSLVDLRSPSRRADYLVIHYDGFKSAADSLAIWRNIVNGYEATTVPVSALYDQFSGGRVDPAAVRNFLRSVYLNWQKKPAFVTLLGDASFDFKNLLGLAPSGQPGTLLPSYENGFDDSPIIYRQFDTDDWLLNVDTAAVVVPDFFGGRIPAGDATTALSIVRNKVLLYERSAPFDEYRNRLMLIADDDRQGMDPDPLRWTHVLQTSELDTAATPRHIDRAYVYMHTYPTGAGFTKPGANADIKKNLNEEGVAIFNYIGHGSPFQLSDERVFLNTDVGTLTNATRLPLFVAASCDVGKFNDPRVLGLGELLLTQPGGGAIGVISSTEEAFSGQNARLNRDLYRFIFSRDSVSGQYHVPLSEALLRGKSGSTNSQKYQLMGDAGTRLNLPRLWTEITLWDSSGTQPLGGVTQGSTVLFRGRILDKPGGAPSPLDGVASILIEDSAPREALPNCTPVNSCSYYYKAGPVYRGELAINGGAFEGRFVVPLDARQGARGRLRAYVSGRAPSVGLTDAVGDLGLQLGPGSAPSGDTEGPRITLSFAGGATSVRPDAVLRVFLFDPSGILITGHTPQNGIVVTLDEDPTKRVDITPSFRYAAGSYQSGSATYQLSGLSAGSHTIRVSAADNLAAGFAAGAHRSSALIEFEVQDLPALDVTRAYLFPNPVHSGGGGSGGQFVIDAPGDSVNVLLRVYTVSGRLVRTLRSFAGLGQVQIAWDGLDEEGQELANGVYVFKAHVYIRQPDGKSSPRQRASTEGKFVVVNR